MNETKLTVLGHLRQFLAGTPEVEFYPVVAADERYQHIVSVLGRFPVHPSQAPGPGRGAVLSDAHHGLFQAAADPAGWPVSGSRPAIQALCRPGPGLCPQVHPGRPDLADADRCPARHPVRSRHLADHAAGVGRLWRYPLRAVVPLSVGHLYHPRKKAGYLDRRQCWTQTRAFQLPLPSQGNTSFSRRARVFSLWLSLLPFI
jgi:hypothetical protein